MKRLSGFLLWLCCCLSLSVGAQNYADMWKQVEKAAKADHPRTVVDVLDRIRDRAVADGNAGQCLKALLMRYRYVTDVSPDSASATLDLLHEGLRLETRDPARALYHVVLGRLEAERLPPYSVNPRVDSLRTAVKTHLSASMEHPGLLADTRASAYLPLITLGADSRHFSDDLLSVVGSCAAETYGMMQNDTAALTALRCLSHQLVHTYRVRGNASAELLATLDSLRHVEPAYIRTAHAERHPVYRFLTDLIRRHADNSLLVEAYIELCERLSSQNDSLRMVWAREGIARCPRAARTDVLRNVVQQMTQPEFAFDFRSPVFYPGTPAVVTWKARNVRNLRLNIYRIPRTASDVCLISPDDKQLMKQARLVSHVDTVLTVPNAYTRVAVPQSFILPEAGMYLLQAVGDGVRSECAFLHVSRVGVMWHSPNGSRHKMALVDARSGHPLSGARLVCYQEKDGSLKELLTCTAGADGLVQIPGDVKKNGDFHFYAVHGNDAYARPLLFYPYSTYRAVSASSVPRMRVQLFTDRAVYRPGQEIRFGGMAYRQQGDQTEVMGNRNYSVVLRAANGKQLDTLHLRTDSMGTFEGVFRLPVSSLNGSYTLSCPGELTSYASVRVEAYKRPTFTVALHQPTVNYILGDTLRVDGEARLLSGASLRDAVVLYSVRRGYMRWSARQTEAFYTGRAVVDAEGRFQLSVPLEPLPDENPADGVPLHFVCFDVEAAVLGSDGQNESARLQLMAYAYYPSPILHWPTCIDRTHLPALYINCRNAMGVACQGEGHYRITTPSGRQVQTGRFTSGDSIRPDALLALPSGRYRLTASLEGADNERSEARRDFVLFSSVDTRPVDTVPLWFHAPAGPAEFGDAPIELQCGTPERDACLYYDLYSGNTCIESKCIHLSDTILRFSYSYQPAYGEGVTAVFGLYRNGCAYTRSFSISKPAPDKRLKLRWTSFRDRLSPGRQEEWRLQVLKPDGTPVRASVMASLYDASLDKFARLYWPFSLRFDRQLVSASWTDCGGDHIFRRAWHSIRSRNVKPLSFSHIEFSSAVRDYKKEVRLLRDAAASGASSDRQVMKLREVAVAAPAAVKMASNARYETVNEDDGVIGALEAEPIAADMLRTNFNETAFFYPRLRTDADGQAVLAFTLPESLTSWNLKVLAHDQQVDYGTLDTTVVAAKDFMLQGNMPRFLRGGDRTQLAFTVRNLTPKDLVGRVRCELLDAETEKRLWHGNLPFRTAAGAQQVVAFDVQADAAHPLLICRAVAETDSFSDGEQTYLPVLSDRVELTESVPFSLHKAGRHTIDLAPLYDRKGDYAVHPRLTLEYTARPMWYVVQALPAMSRIDTEDALTLASAYYAASLSEQLLLRSPQVRRAAGHWQRSADSLHGATPLARNEDLKQLLLDETPWVLSANDEAERTARLAEYYHTDAVAVHVRTCTDKLAALQRADGSWSWFKGMPGNDYMTLGVAELLVRLEQMQAGSEMSASLERALAFLDQRVVAQVDNMKKEEARGGKPYVNEWQVRYLWVKAHSRHKSAAGVKRAADYLIRKLTGQQRSATIYQKALEAVVLHCAGEKQAASSRLQSLLEYTVATPEAGRYFDTDKAALSWDSYRIPTQVAAIEALRTVAPDNTAARREMVQWLLQAKRTQHWGNQRNSVDAVYALLAEESFGDDLRPASSAGAPTFAWIASRRREMPLAIAPDATAGYVRTTSQTDALKSRPAALTVVKPDSAVAWGAVYASFTVSCDEASAAGSGLKVTSAYYRENNGRWEPLSGSASLAVGDKVRAVYTIAADRDYDYVCLKAPRPACLEPVMPLSGYDGSAGRGAYRDVKDASVNYFFERLPKGTLQLAVDSRVDRRGTFQCGLATVQSVYAPEFSGHTAGRKLEVK